MPDFMRARCRLMPDFWKVAAICLAMLLLFAGMAIMQPPRGGEGWFSLAALFALFGATPFYWLMARARGAVIFDANGVRWRTALGIWKRARWDEIERADVRMISTGDKSTHWKFVIRTREREFSWTNSFENADQLAPFGARFCPLIEADSENWPRRFDYQRGDNLLFWLVSLFLGGGFLFILFKVLSGVQWGDVFAQIEIYVELYGWILTLSGFALFGIIMAAIPAFFLLIFSRMALDGWRRRGETFVATTRGLSWSKRKRELLFAAWDELQMLQVEARGPLISLPFTRLQSARGEFSWNNELSGNSQLLRTCFERAPQLEHVVQARLREELDEIGDDQGEVLTFNHRTRSLRALLWGGVFFSLFCWGIVVYGPIQPANGDAPAPTWVTFIIAFITTAATLYGAQLFRRGCIALDARGIRWRLPLRSRFVAWEEIDALLVERKLYLQVGARRVPLFGGGLHPTHVERLLETVAARAVNAGGAWKPVDETLSVEAAE